VPNAGVSSVTGKGFDTLWEKFDILCKDYTETFLPELKVQDKQVRV